MRPPMNFPLSGKQTGDNEPTTGFLDTNLISNGETWVDTDGAVVDSGLTLNAFPDDWYVTNANTTYSGRYTSGFDEDRFEFWRTSSPTTTPVTELFEQQISASLNTKGFLLQKINLTLLSGGTITFQNYAQTSSGGKEYLAAFIYNTSSSANLKWTAAFINAATMYVGSRGNSGALNVACGFDYHRAYEAIPQNNREGWDSGSGVVWGITEGGADFDESATNVGPDGWTYASATPLGRLTSEGYWRHERNGTVSGDDANLEYTTVSVSTGDMIVVGYEVAGATGGNVYVEIEDAAAAVTSISASTLNTALFVSHVATGDGPATIKWRPASTTTQVVEMKKLGYVVIPAAFVT